MALPAACVAASGRRTRSCQGATYVNVGFWGTVPIQPGAADGDQNRAVEAAVTRLGGHKSLYSDAYYDRQTFDRLYGVANQRTVKQQTDPDNRLTGLYEKVVESSMTSTLNRPDTITIAEAMSRLLANGMPFRFTAYDGSQGGPADAALHLHLKNERGLSYLLTAPGDLGMARAYVVRRPGCHRRASRRPVPRDGRPADQPEVQAAVARRGVPDRPVPRLQPLPAAAAAAAGGAAAGGAGCWRGSGTRRARDAEAIHHHYDVSNRFYEMILGPSMTYTCACFPSQEASLEEAQYFKYDLVAKKLGLRPGMRLLDVGSGWGGMVRHAARYYDVEVVGVTLSREQAAWAQDAIKRDGLDAVAEVRFGDYRDVRDNGFDAVSSIGLTEHIGIRNYPSYFAFLRDKLVPGGRLLNHCITRPDNDATDTGEFIDRYVFPDGELTGSGRIITEIQNAGLEVRHEENLREHYALTLKGWCENLVDNWDECVREVGEGTAKVWGLYMAGSRLSLRAERDPAAPGARGQAGRGRQLALPAAPHLARLTGVS